MLDMFSDCRALLPFFGILLSAVVALYIYSKNRRYDIAKEKLKNLYNPLNACIEKNLKYLELLKYRDKERYDLEYYKFFLELRDIYLDNALYGSTKLRWAFHTLRHSHEIEYGNYSKKKISPDDVIKEVAKFELNHQVDKEDQSEFERNMDELFEVISTEQYALFLEMDNIFHQKIYTPKNDEFN